MLPATEQGFLPSTASAVDRRIERGTQACVETCAARATEFPLQLHELHR